MFSQPPVCWNIFVRELATILATRDLVVGSLGNKDIGLHSQKVDRLRKTCLSDEHLYALSPDDLDLIYAVLHFTNDEVLTIRASLIALAAERFLMDRIPSISAYLAADEVFHTMKRVLVSTNNPVLADVKGVSAFAAGATAFDEALDLIDEAMLNLHMSRDAADGTTKLANALKARAGFDRAITLLESLPQDAHTESWQVWYAEAQQGAQQAEKLRTLAAEMR